MLPVTPRGHLIEASALKKATRRTWLHAAFTLRWFRAGKLLRHVASIRLSTTGYDKPGKLVKRKWGDGKAKLTVLLMPSDFSLLIGVKHLRY